MRPTSETLARREQAFARHLATEGSFVEAARAAGIDHRHIIRLLDRPDFRPIAAAILAEQAA